MWEAGQQWGEEGKEKSWVARASLFCGIFLSTAWTFSLAPSQTFDLNLRSLEKEHCWAGSSYQWLNLERQLWLLPPSADTLLSMPTRMVSAVSPAGAPVRASLANRNYSSGDGSSSDDDFGPALPTGWRPKRKDESCPSRRSTSGPCPPRPGTPNRSCTRTNCLS